ncbi:hypothetical protein BCR44DRAFT_50910 [Catenaria anguillulae PL171]|uniref:Uncharacterized protein n=1 Tax=Catenaria anguillulae PL171 TaxID=765915 RepID=A0A1Y2HXC2_9FUNG|nr:hypothetical protein BCR44DRAFT_50910 [Catenaria anguillulae PL171]
MFLDHAAWLAANLGLLGSPTAHLGDTTSWASAASASFKQRVTNAVTWALAVHAQDMVISPLSRSGSKALPWLATLPLSTSSPAPPSRGSLNSVPVTNYLEWWISVERGDGSVRLLSLRPRALPQPSRRIRQPPAAANTIQTLSIGPPPSNPNYFRLGHPASIPLGSPAPYTTRDPSFISAREPPDCGSGVEGSDFSTCVTAASSHSLASSHFRGQTSDDVDFAQWFLSSSSGPSNAVTECSLTVAPRSNDIVDEFDLPFDDDDTSFDGSWSDSDSVCMCGKGDCASFDNEGRASPSESIPSSPPPIHLSSRRLGYQGSPQFVSHRIGTPPTAVFEFQTPSAPPTPTSAMAPRSCSSSSPSLLFDQPLLPTDHSAPTSTAPSPPLTPKFTVITLAQPDSPPLTCPLPLPESASSDFACAADESCRSASASPTVALAGSVAAIARPGRTVGQGGSPPVSPMVTAESLLFA